jgi:hypothetical protein
MALCVWTSVNVLWDAVNDIVERNSTDYESNMHEGWVTVLGILGSYTAAGLLYAVRWACRKHRGVELNITGTTREELDLMNAPHLVSGFSSLNRSTVDSENEVGKGDRHPLLRGAIH